MFCAQWSGGCRSCLRFSPWGVAGEYKIIAATQGGGAFSWVTLGCFYTAPPEQITFWFFPCQDPAVFQPCLQRGGDIPWGREMLGATVMVAMARAATIPVVPGDQSCQHVAAGSPGAIGSQVRAGCVGCAGLADVALLISQTVRACWEAAPCTRSFCTGWSRTPSSSWEQPGVEARAGLSTQHGAHAAHRQVSLAGAQQ